MERRFFLIQRLSAMVLAPLVLVHLGLIMYAVRDGLTAQEILDRTQGSVAWAIFYTCFVIAAALHAPIGLRAILVEWVRVPLKPATAIAMLFSAGLIWTGLRAVAAVTGFMGTGSI